ncbi:MAG: hypothetical protein ACD_62C00691G0015 [uncultured bacterium]|nr:MAG: hypothetical protein ACD_62C00691G0015 [uncultured bacterium]
MMVLKTYISKKSCLHHAVIQVLFIICLGVIGCRGLQVVPSDDTIASGEDALPVNDSEGATQNSGDDPTAENDNVASGEAENDDNELFDNGVEDDADDVEGAEDQDDDADQDNHDDEVIAFDPSDYTVWIANTSSPGRVYIKDALTAQGYLVVDDVDETDLSGNILADVVVIPGGTDALDYGRNEAVRTSLQAFVAGGGHFIGVCGGAIAGSQGLYVNYGGAEVLVPGYAMLDLLHVKGLDNIDWMNEYMTAAGQFYPFNTPILFNDHPINSPYLYESLIMAYRAGPVLKFFDNPDPGITVIGTFTENLDPSVTAYEISGQPAVVAGSYGNGRVVLFSVHPEYSYPDYQEQIPPPDDTKPLFINAVRWVIEGE